MKTESKKFYKWNFYFSPILLILNIIAVIPYLILIFIFAGTDYNSEEAKKERKEYTEKRQMFATVVSKRIEGYDNYRMIVKLPHSSTYTYNLKTTEFKYYTFKPGDRYEILLSRRAINDKDTENERKISFKKPKEEEKTWAEGVLALSFFLSLFMTAISIGLINGDKRHKQIAWPMILFICVLHLGFFILTIHYLL